MDRFSIMERQWVGGFMRLVIMDWNKAEIITLMAHELDDENIDKELSSFIKNMLPVLKKPLWKSSWYNASDGDSHSDTPHP